MVTSSTASPAKSRAVAREVGTEGRLGGQAQVPGVRYLEGSDHTVNVMAANLTEQVRAS